MSKQSEELEIEMSELTEKRRYGLILRGVKIGLNKIGIDNVFITIPEVKNGKFTFKVEKD